MVLLTTTPTILRAIQALPATIPAFETGSLPSSLTQPICHKALIHISKCTPFTLSRLLRGTKPYTPPPLVHKPTPEYEALMARLRADQERKTYQALLQQQQYDAQQALNGQIDEQQEQPDDISPSLVVNILLSVVMCAGAAFYMTRWWTNDGVRVLVSLSVAIVVGVAEVTVYAGYLRKVQESKTKERRKRERKEVIGEYTGEGIDAWGQEVETTEVWGRGVNGGMRRRVRKKWERSQQQNEN